MSVFRPTYRDKQTGELKRSDVWWIEVIYAGRRIRESTNSPKKTIALQVEKRRRDELERALAGVPLDKPEQRIATVAEKIRHYSEHYAASHRPKSVIFSKQRLAHAERLLGAVMLFDLGEDVIRGYIRKRQSEGAGNRTINMEVGELSRAVGRKWSAMWPGVKKLEEHSDVGRALSPEEELRLLEAAALDDSPNRNQVLYTFIRIALTTGMRSGEICALTWGQVDFMADTITVGRAKTAAGTGREIPMNSDLRAVMEMHAGWFVKRLGEIRSEWFVFPGRAGKPSDGRERPLDPTRSMREIKTSWATLRDRANVNCRLHDLRHTVATKMAEAGVPEATMKALLGHMSARMLERYSHIRKAAKRDAVAALRLPEVGNLNSKVALQVSPKVEGERAIQ